jgi:homoserine dehydrogenase
VPEASLLGQSIGPANVVNVTGRYGGTTQFAGAGAGGLATAVAVVSDLVALTRERAARVPRRAIPAAVLAPPPQRFYVRMVADNWHDGLAALSTALGRHRINLDFVLREPDLLTKCHTVVVTVEPCDERQLERALEGVAGSSRGPDVPLALPMLNE